MEGCGKGTVCVTGGTGFLASWLISKLLDHGYSVNTTIRSSPERKRDISYLTDLPGASERLRIFYADLDKPDSFDPAMQGCIGVFHVSHPMVFKGEETEEENTRKSINGTLGILQACLNAKTVKRVVYTSSISTVVYCEGVDIVDESKWSDIDYIRNLNSFGSVYSISKTLTEKACIEFAEKHGLDLVTVLPCLIHGPFITPNLPISVGGAMSMISGGQQASPPNIPFVHTDDVARAHIFLFEYPDAKGRYICSALEITVHDLAEFLSARYPEYQIKTPDSLNKSEIPYKLPSVSSKKLLDTGFKYSHGLEEIYDDAIRCYKEKALL